MTIEVASNIDFISVHNEPMWWNLTTKFWLDANQALYTHSNAEVNTAKYNVNGGTVYEAILISRISENGPDVLAVIIQSN